MIAVIIVVVIIISISISIATYFFMKTPATPAASATPATPAVITIPDFMISKTYTVRNEPGPVRFIFGRPTSSNLLPISISIGGSNQMMNDQLEPISGTSTEFSGKPTITTGDKKLGTFIKKANHVEFITEGVAKAVILDFTS